jgi:hypothetical protein
VVAKKTKSRQARYNAITGDAPVPAGSLQVGDKVLLDGKLLRLTAVNDDYVILRESDADYEITVTTQRVMVTLVERYVARANNTAGIDPLAGE